MKKIKRLLLSITSDCNLNCCYCYVFRDKIGCFPPAAMNPELVKKSLRKIYKESKEINFIQFFGGEPNLALETMESAVFEIDRLCREKQMARPQLGIITNLTILNEKILSFYKNNNLQITVSLDGPRLIHDELRKYRNGNGTHDNIVANLKKLKIAGLDYSLEATFTGKHLQKNISVSDLLKHFDELGAVRGDVVNIMEKSGSDLCVYGKNLSKTAQSFSEAIDYWFTYRKNGGKMIFGMAAEIAGLLLKQKEKEQIKNRHCLAGDSYLAVAADGKIYPCHLFIGNDKYLLGNAKTKEPLLEMPGNKKEIEFCQDCPAGHFCLSCKGKNEYYNKSSEKPFMEDCLFKQEIINKVLDKITDK